MPPRSPSGDDDERSPRTPREDDARSTASSQRSARKDDDDARSTTSSRRSARKTPRAKDDDDDDLASVQSEQDAAVAKARALRLLLAFEDSGRKLKDVLKSKDYDAEALLDAFVGREHLKELGNDECDALIEKAGDGVNVTRDQLGHWLKLERSRLCEELMQRLAPAPAPAPAPVSTATCNPRATSFFTAIGVSGQRDSPATTCLGTAICMRRLFELPQHPPRVTVTRTGTSVML